MKKIIIILAVVLFMPFNVKADYEVIDVRCTNVIKKKLREDANDVVYRLNLRKEENNISYSAYFYNVTENLELVDSNNQTKYNFQIDNIKPGSSITVNLYASNKTYCEGYKVLTKIINVPYYNPYYGSDLCVGNEEFSLCAENANVNLNEKEFKKRIDKYRESLQINKEEEEIIEDVVEESFFNLFDFITEYKLYILSVLVLILLILISVIIINKRKNKSIL